MSTGYKGFRSWAAQECPTLKPGETYDTRATKFSQMGSSIVSPPTSIRAVNPSFEAVTRNHYGQVTPQDFSNPVRAAKDSGEIAHSRTFLGQSLYQRDFVNFHEEGKRIAELSMDAFQAAFDSLAEEPNQESPDAVKKISRDDVGELLQTVYGKTPATRILEIYAHMFDVCPDGIVTWEVFQEATLRLSSFLLHQTIKPSSHSIGWVDFVKKVLPNGTPSSSHQIDYGTYGSDPLARPYMNRSHGMASTTSDLFDGSTKASYHIPRYQGFIPHTKYNPTAMSQGECEKPRPKAEDLRLYHSNNIPGYTGHKPVDSKNVRGEAKTGSDVRTTNGLVYKPHF
ncbi:ATPase, P-type (transporting), HAD super, sub IC [Aphanomyces cochlioides]|nr:ATPase, P-type (transporting), HAD super, sub IC [Aphanomyces cochlioides]